MRWKILIGNIIWFIGYLEKISKILIYYGVILDNVKNSIFLIMMIMLIEFKLKVWRYNKYDRL